MRPHVVTIAVPSCRGYSSSASPSYGRDDGVTEALGDRLGGRCGRPAGCGLPAKPCRAQGLPRFAPKEEPGSFWVLLKADIKRAYAGKDTAIPPVPVAWKARRARDVGHGIALRPLWSAEREIKEDRHTALRPPLKCAWRLTYQWLCFQPTG